MNYTANTIATTHLRGGCCDVDNSAETSYTLHAGRGIIETSVANVYCDI